ncbi:hypothetical protein WN944_025908 [Citrus x changshan-huyou]|uniref:Uncharacterized protein n=1 Tax=Citrus x changshan-huyou TaxID=2935761 RepID=A0AAP0LRH1_9ROSI
MRSNILENSELFSVNLNLKSSMRKNARDKEIFIVQIKEDSEGHFVKKAEIRTATVMVEKLNKIIAVSTAPKKAADKAA